MILSVRNAPQPLFRRRNLSPATVSRKLAYMAAGNGTVNIRRRHCLSVSQTLNYGVIEINRLRRHDKMLCHEDLTESIPFYVRNYFKLKLTSSFNISCSLEEVTPAFLSYLIS